MASSVAIPTGPSRSKVSKTRLIPIDFNACLYKPLREADPEIAELIEKETYRQFSGLELIA